MGKGAGAELVLADNPLGVSLVFLSKSQAYK